MSCNKCNKMSCGCADHGLTTPCSYTDCSTPGAESCESVQCDDCVSHCGNTFSVDASGVEFKIESGERLSKTLQRIALFLKDPACIDLAPTGVNATEVTTTSVSLVWFLSTTAAVDIEYKDVNSAGWATASSGVTGNVFEIINLTSGTDYLFRVVNGSCESVELHITTL